MGKIQKFYSKEFKEEAVRPVQTSGKSIAQIARELGISDSAIHTWRKELAKHGEEAFPGKGHQTALEEENRRLKRDLERVQTALLKNGATKTWIANKYGTTRRNLSHIFWGLISKESCALGRTTWYETLDDMTRFTFSRAV
ncbi:hypothetical protein KDI_27910 [Dictyobacter arantiisoli]|uniref:Transposase n=1 Tax=Dictyobacter arantiisoli TaxID=2014874 RepID=A0A5A5TD09_9CHLR|nr:transposase [Dictyobacter arantiisoli]GCF09227.1 hypothetical protein KDI_27910 [Dictyobacter arantiisoli]